MDAMIAPVWMGISLFWIALLAWRWNKFPHRPDAGEHMRDS